MTVDIAADGTVRMTLSEVAVRERARSAVTQSIEIVRRRIDQTGVNEPTIQVQGSDRILVQLRSEEHTSELQSLMRISYAVFCLKKQKKNTTHPYTYSSVNK